MTAQIGLPGRPEPLIIPRAGPASAAVTAAGYQGYVEVEIFNADVWDAPADQTAATVRERFARVLGGGETGRG